MALTVVSGAIQRTHPLASRVDTFRLSTMSTSKLVLGTTSGVSFDPSVCVWRREAVGESFTLSEELWGHTLAVNGISMVEDAVGDMYLCSIGRDQMLCVWFLSPTGRASFIVHRLMIDFLPHKCCLSTMIDAAAAAILVVVGGEGRQLWIHRALGQQLGTTHVVIAPIVFHSLLTFTMGRDAFIVCCNHQDGTLCLGELAQIVKGNEWAIQPMPPALHPGRMTCMYIMEKNNNDRNHSHSGSGSSTNLNMNMNREEEVVRLVRQYAQCQVTCSWNRTEGWQALEQKTQTMMEGNPGSLVHHYPLHQLRSTQSGQCTAAIPMTSSIPPVQLQVDLPFPLPLSLPGVEDCQSICKWRYLTLDERVVLVMLDVEGSLFFAGRGGGNAGGQEIWRRLPTLLPMGEYPPIANIIVPVISSIPRSQNLSHSYSHSEREYDSESAISPEPPLSPTSPLGGEVPTQRQRLLCFTTSPLHNGMIGWWWQTGQKSVLPIRYNLPGHSAIQGAGYDRQHQLIWALHTEGLPSFTLFLPTSGTVVMSGISLTALLPPSPWTWLQGVYDQFRLDVTHVTDMLIGPSSTALCMTMGCVSMGVIPIPHSQQQAVLLPWYARFFALGCGEAILGSAEKEKEKEKEKEEEKEEEEGILPISSDSLVAACNYVHGQSLNIWVGQGALLHVLATLAASSTLPMGVAALGKCQPPVSVSQLVGRVPYLLSPENPVRLRTLQVLLGVLSLPAGRALLAASCTMPVMKALLMALIPTTLIETSEEFALCYEIIGLCALMMPQALVECHYVIERSKLLWLVEATTAAVLRNTACRERAVLHAFWAFSLSKIRSPMPQWLHALRLCRSLHIWSIALADEKLVVHPRVAILLYSAKRDIMLPRSFSPEKHTLTRMVGIYDADTSGESEAWRVCLAAAPVDYAILAVALSPAGQRLGALCCPISVAEPGEQPTAERSERNPLPVECAVCWWDLPPATAPSTPKAFVAGFRSLFGGGSSTPNNTKAPPACLSPAGLAPIMLSEVVAFLRYERQLITPDDRHKPPVVFPSL
jgi:hypothetical protein